MFKQRRITLAAGKALMEQFRLIPFQVADVDLEAAVELAYRMNIYAYDAYIIQCAKQTGLRILTLDGGLVNAARQAGVAVIEVQT